MRLFSFLIILPFLFFGCALQKDTQVVYPKWYLKIQKDNHRYIYGEAEGETFKDSTAIALNNIASKISVIVQSTYRSTTTTTTTTYDKTIQRDIKNSVKKIKFNNYKIIKKTILNNQKHLVLVEVDKIKLANGIKTKLDNQIAILKSSQNGKSYDIVSRLKKYQKISKKISKIKSNIYILHTLDNSFDIKKYLQIINNTNQQINNYKKSITIGVLSKNNNDYKKLLISLITKKGYKVVSSKKSKLNISIKIQEKKIKILGNKIIKAKIDLKTTNKANTKILGQKQIFSGGKSNTKFPQAHEFSLINFENKLKSKNILFEMLGIY
jgi:hypothetical protein